MAGDNGCGLPVDGVAVTRGGGMNLRELSLFSGAGGGLLGTHLLGWKPIGYVEYDDYCQRVIRQRILDGILPVAPIFGDVREFVQSGAAAEYRGFADVVTGGWPCQPHSTAGKRQGASDEREGWPYIIETIRQVRPRWFLGENVPGILSTDNGRYFGAIQRDLAQSGYDCRWRVLSAAELGAPHKRDRLWLVAHCSSERTRGLSVRQGRQDQASTDIDGGGEDVAHTHSGCSERTQDKVRAGWDIAELSSENVSDANESGWPVREQCRREQCKEVSYQERHIHHWPPEPNVGRVANGVASRVDRLKAIGNGQVPAVVAAAWHLLMEDL